MTRNIDNVAFDASVQNGGAGGDLYCINLQNPSGSLDIVNNTFAGNTATHTIFG